jgi:hypothetical protein
MEGLKCLLNHTQTQQEAKRMSWEAERKLYIAMHLASLTEVFDDEMMFDIPRLYIS